MRFKKLGFAIAFSVAVVSMANSQTNTDQSLLWEISGNGLKENSYLFGTIHLICPSDFLMDDRIKNAFEDADELILELDMDDPEMMQKMQQNSLNPEMKNIKSAFSESDANALNEFLTANYGAGLDQLGILKPFMLMSMITVKQLPCEQIESYELFFTNLAKTQNKNVEGLESVEFQMGLFDEIPEEILLKEISKMVTTDDSIKEFE